MVDENWQMNGTTSPMDVETPIKGSEDVKGNRKVAENETETVVIDDDDEDDDGVIDAEQLEEYQEMVDQLGTFPVSEYARHSTSSNSTDISFLL